MKGIGTLGKRLVGASAGGAGVIAAQQPANARAPPAAQPAPVQAHVENRKLDDGWLLTDFNEDKLLFKPFSPSEVEEAVEQVGLAGARQGPAPHACVVEELDEQGPTSPSTGASSEGGQADRVIESTHISPQQQQMAELLKISNKLLQRPGLQREIVAVMYEDLEVRELLLRQSSDLDQYLATVGVHSPNLLLPPSAQAASHDGEEGGLPPVLEAIMNAVTSCLDGVGWLAGSATGWIRDRFQSLGDMLATKMGFKDPQAGPQEQQKKGQRGPNQGGGKGTQTVMTTVMVISVALLCMLLTKRPILRRA
ncbi:hypothetical protein DUNSADRAFT_14374 [Dunaliella salina]|uniref:Uncharacterized protein n=1 Tax=Dunaliella salina TaxID=3046 RepID=A0ABQ7G7G3_DUNSA|nr:hypothetical protein DUNSADRAFT_14374 [Dunaliella salina]|eukprot:KAF5830545.1 hypothetical protein DUNSADRAFT_14374 [Dunaliella salina]